MWAGRADSREVTGERRCGSGMAGAKTGSEVGQGGPELTHSEVAPLGLSWRNQEGLLRQSLSSQKPG